MKKNIIIVSILFIIAIVLKFIFPCCDLFSYNLMEILTAIVFTYGLYCISENKSEKKQIKSKVEEIIELIQKKLDLVFSSPIDVDNKAEYLHSFKYLYSKVNVLKKLCINLDCSNELNNIESELKKLDEFINDNLEQGNEYFNSGKLKAKVPNIICNIENNLDAITIKLYE